jgi:hypothetical protein
MISINSNKVQKWNYMPILHRGGYTINQQIWHIWLQGTSCGAYPSGHLSFNISNAQKVKTYMQKMWRRGWQWGQCKGWIQNQLLLAKYVLIRRQSYTFVTPTILKNEIKEKIIHLNLTAWLYSFAIHETNYKRILAPFSISIAITGIRKTCITEVSGAGERIDLTESQLFISTL